MQKSHHYSRARLLKQLENVRVMVSSQIPEILSLHQASAGKKWGDLKHDILSTKSIEKDLAGLSSEIQFTYWWYS